MKTPMSIPLVAIDGSDREGALQKLTIQHVCQRYKSAMAQQLGHSLLHFPEIKVMAEHRSRPSRDAGLFRIQLPRMEVQDQGSAIVLADPRHGPPGVPHGQYAQIAASSKR